MWRLRTAPASTRAAGQTGRHRWHQRRRRSAHISW